MDMNRLHNDKGSSLIYVVFALALISVFIVPLLTMSGTVALTDKNREFEIKADNFSKSLADSFNDYVQSNCKVNGVVPKACVEAFPAAGTHAVILPEGTRLEYTLTVALDPATTTLPTTDPLYRSYKFSVSTVTSGHTTPSKTSVISYYFKEPPSTVYSDTGGGGNLLLLPPDPSYTSATDQKDLPHNGVITTSTPDPTLSGTQFDTMFDQLVPPEPDLLATSYADLISKMRYQSADNATTIIKVTCSPCSGSLSYGSSSTSFLTEYPTRKYVIYFENSDVNLQNWRMNGMMIVNGDLDTTSLGGNEEISVDNMVVNGTYYAGSNTKNFFIAGICAIRSYTSSGGGGSAFPDITFTTTTYDYLPSSGWDPDPVRGS